LNCFLTTDHSGFKRNGEYHNQYESFALAEAGTDGFTSTTASLGSRKNSAAPGGDAKNHRYEISFENITQQARVPSLRYISEFKKETRPWEVVTMTTKTVKKVCTQKIEQLEVPVFRIRIHGSGPPPLPLFLLCGFLILTRARICKRLRSPGIDSVSLCSLVVTGWYDK
jgi:hypothetical protein